MAPPLPARPFLPQLQARCPHTPAQFYEKINKIDTSLTRLTNKDRRHELPESRTQEETSLPNSEKLKGLQTNMMNNFMPIN